MKVYAWGTWSYKLHVLINGKFIFSWSPNNDVLSRYDGDAKYYYRYVKY